MCHTYLVGYLLGRKIAKAYNILLLPIEYNKYVVITVMLKKFVIVFSTNFITVIQHVQILYVVNFDQLP